MTLNATYAIADIGTYSVMGGWLITLIIFILTFVTLFLMFKNIRRCIYGSVINALLLGTYKLSRYIGVSTQNGNFIPLKTFGWVVGWIIAAIILGYLFERTRWGKELEERTRR